LNKNIIVFVKKSLELFTWGHSAVVPSGVAMGCARRAVHAGPSLWVCEGGADEEGWPYWNPCSRTRYNLAMPLVVPTCQVNAYSYLPFRRRRRRLVVQSLKLSTISSRTYPVVNAIIWNTCLTLSFWRFPSTHSGSNC